MDDTFRGDDAHLVRSIEAHLALDAAGALVPHGVGGLARVLLASAAARLSAALARSGQDSSGSSQGARSDVQNGLGVGQPEAPTAAPLGWKLVPTDPSNAMLLPIVRAFKCGHAEAWKVLSEAIAAHPPARSGAGSEEAQPDRSEES